MNDAALLDSLHAALRNPDLAWYTEFHAGESIVAGYLDSLTDPYDDTSIRSPITSIGTAKGSRHTTCTAHRTSPA